MITEFGKALRKLRIEEDERLLDMSKRINKSSAFISAVERGDKSPPMGFEELVIVAYKLTESSADELRSAADASRRAFTIEPKSPLERDTAGLMARRMNSTMNTLSADELEKILAILRKEGSDR
ncbi:XRE family transcriptional regulator [Ruegeria atlantica]|uniref:XRE family transcriptional regulator n=1 Tax=Ruegeria atlantica TaxID=81569 RepID=UPI0014798EF4|nr:XRE family transcriptional regulator [Ruegeria atlantica]